MKYKYYEQVRAVQKINHVKIAQNLSFRIKLGGNEILFLTLRTGERGRERERGGREGED
jgi:hypothetical protein